MSKKQQISVALALELVGQVNILEKEPGKRTKKTPLDGKVVLECVLDVLRRALDTQGLS